MFGQRNEGGNEALVENVLIPTQFWWPHGGKKVYLTGSFLSWSEPRLMSPSEGCPTLFQVTCMLPPGSHQYKFNVDGEWRHDHEKPIARASFGVVNTIHVGTLAVGVSETSGRMEVDEHHESVPRLTDSDIEVSRLRISVFMSTHTAYELFPESGRVVALDVTLPVKQAFHILHEQGISVAPLWDFSSGHFVGVLSAMDFIMILRELGNRGSSLTEEELETHSILAWKEGKLNLNRQPDGSGRAFPSQLIHAGPNESLRDVALKILQHKVATVPIIHSSSDDGSFPQLLHMASLSGILNCICRHFKHSPGSLPILQQPISEFRLGTWVSRVGESNGKTLVTLRPNDSLGTALSLLVKDEVSSIPIVDDKGSLLDIYSRSDITALARDRAYAQIHLDELSIQQALQLGQDRHCQMGLRSDSLHTVMERLAKPGVRRLVIVEAGSKCVEGIISLSDVLRFLVG